MPVLRDMSDTLGQLALVRTVHPEDGGRPALALAQLGCPEVMVWSLSLGKWYSCGKLKCS